jgi:hypothetical protein
MAQRRGKGVALAALALISVAGVASGCGGDDFENEERPPVPLEATVEVTDKAVQVSPPSFGAGLANFSIANNASKEIVLTIDGPTEDASLPIEPHSNTVLKMQMEQGDYDAGVEGDLKIESAKITVGAERESAQNDLLLP